MNIITHTRLTGLLFIVGAVLVNIPYTLLIINFDYPAILRQPPGQILTHFQAGGTGLILTWLAFAWIGSPLLFALVMLQKVLEQKETPYLWSATVAGIIGGVAQMIGLLRWVFVIPLLANTYTNPTTSVAAKEAAVLAFQVLHQAGGVVLGEHIGQSFTILWLLLISLTLGQTRRFRPWLAWMGILAAGVYALAQTELLATVIPDFPVVPAAGLLGSLLWLGWLIALGICVVRIEKVVTVGMVQWP